MLGMRFWNQSLGFVYKSGLSCGWFGFDPINFVCWFGCLICDCIVPSLSFEEWTQRLVSDIFVGCCFVT